MRTHGRPAPRPTRSLSLAGLGSALAASLLLSPPALSQADRKSVV